MTGRDRVRSVVDDAWRAALGADEPLPDEGFFALGGDSMSALAFVVQVETELEIAFPMDMLFAERQLAEIVAECESRHAAEQPAP